jgi:hypothetical protein
MPLEIHQVPTARMIRAAEEVIETDLIERGTRGVGRDMAANPLMLAVRLDHHRHRVPADDALDS